MSFTAQPKITIPAPSTKGAVASPSIPAPVAKTAEEKPSVPAPE